MEILTHASALPTIFDPAVLMLVLSYLFKAVAFLMVSGAVYALLHRLLANKHGLQADNSPTSITALNDWSHTEIQGYQEAEYHEA